MKNEELTMEEKADLKRVTGQMLCNTSQIRPNLCYEACIMINISKQPKIKMRFID